MQAGTETVGKNIDPVARRVVGGWQEQDAGAGVLTSCVPAVAAFLRCIAFSYRAVCIVQDGKLLLFGLLTLTK